MSALTRVHKLPGTPIEPASLSGLLRVTAVSLWIASTTTLVDYFWIASLESLNSQYQIWPVLHVFLPSLSHLPSELDYDLTLYYFVIYILCVPV